MVGGRITVVGKKDSEAVWTFAFEAAQTAHPAAHLRGRRGLPVSATTIRPSSCTPTARME